MSYTYTVLCLLLIRHLWQCKISSRSSRTPRSPPVLPREHFNCRTFHSRTQATSPRPQCCSPPRQACTHACAHDPTATSAWLNVGQLGRLPQCSCWARCVQHTQFALQNAECFTRMTLGRQEASQTQEHGTTEPHSRRCVCRSSATIESVWAPRIQLLDTQRDADADDVTTATVMNGNRPPDCNHRASKCFM